MGRFDFSGLSDEQIDDAMELYSELGADALWLEEEIKKDKISKNAAAGQAAEEKEENQ